MRPTFTITNPLNELPLDRGTGELQFTVTNTSPYEVRGRTDVELDRLDGIELDWFEVEPPRVRSFGPNETAIVTMRVEVPPGQADVRPRLGLSVSNVERPQEDYCVSMSLPVLGVAWAEAAAGTPWFKRHPWPIVLIVTAVLLVAAIVFAIVAATSGPGLEGRSLAEALTRVHEQGWELADVNWEFDAEVQQQKRKSGGVRRFLRPGGTVLRANVADGEATLVIQRFHPYDPPQTLAARPKARSAQVAQLTDLCVRERDQARSYKLARWLNPIAADVNQATNGAAPIADWKSYVVIPAPRTD